MAELGLAPISDHDPARRQLIDHFLNLMASATRYKDRLSRFPGTMPATLSRRHLDMVCISDYVCLEKSDGTRYMLLAVSTHVLLIDRRMNVYVVEPNPQIMSKGFVRLQDNTILDGELTYNLITRNWEYLIYDAVIIDSDMSIATLGFRQRMQAAEMFVAGPRLWAPFCAGLLRLRIKDFYERNQIRRLFDHIRKDPSGKYIYINNDRRDGVLCNENDGVIFAPVKLEYQLKSSNALLKWKPPHLNSVDFQMQLTRIQDPRRKEPSVRVVVAYKGDGSGLQPLREVYVPHKLRSKWAHEFEKYNNSIAEFAYDRSAGEWRYIRQREDKDIPNFQNTIISTIETIAESIEREEMVLRMEQTPAAPRDEKEFVEFNSTNIAKCTFQNDYFDEENHDYLVATPISMTPPPHLPHATLKDSRRSRHSTMHMDSTVANGDVGRLQEEKASDNKQGRSQFVYADDV